MIGSNSLEVWQVNRDLEGHKPATWRTKKTQGTSTDFSLVSQCQRGLFRKCSIKQGRQVLIKRTKHCKPVNQKKGFGQRQDMKRKTYRWVSNKWTTRIDRMGVYSLSQASQGARGGRKKLKDVQSKKKKRKSQTITEAQSQNNASKETNRSRVLKTFQRRTPTYLLWMGQVERETTQRVY